MLWVLIRIASVRVFEAILMNTHNVCRVPTTYVVGTLRIALVRRFHLGKAISSQLGDCNEYPQRMILWRNLENYL